MIFASRGEAVVSEIVETRSSTARGWRSAIEGIVPTSNTISSGASSSPTINGMSQARLYLTDLDGNETYVATTVANDWTVTAQRLAYIRALPSNSQHEDSEAVRQAGLSEAGVVILGDASTNLTLRNVPYAAVVGPSSTLDSLRWSPSGNELAFLAFRTRQDRVPALYRVNGVTGLGRTYTLLGLHKTVVDGIQWSGDDVLVYGEPTEGGRVTNGAQPNWWRFTSDGTLAAVSTQFHVPRTIIPLPDHSRFAFLSAGDVWRVSPHSGLVENLTANLPPVSVDAGFPSWPKRVDDNQTYNKVVVSYNGEYWIVDLNSGHQRSLESPEGGAELVDFSPVTESAIFRTDNDHGTCLWRVSPGRPPEVLSELNQFLNQVSPNRWRRIDYTSERGDALVGWLLLPPDFEEGRRYPMVTIPYPDSVGSADGPQSSAYAFERTNDNFLNTQVLAGRGYVVLFPSMPLNPYGQPDEPYRRLTEGVVPAVDRAVETGIADADRLFLLGHSFGGYATYGLVTQTSRFRAAVAISGFVDVMSSYGTFSGRQRYTDRPHLDLRNTTDILGQIRMVVPPWEDAERYFRNSPIIHANQVETPIMMIHGDMDQVPIEQAEEFFRAMYAQGKRAEFVRYWGEGHSIQSPANVRDLWDNIFRWFAENGGIPIESVDPSTTDRQAY